MPLTKQKLQVGDKKEVFNSYELMNIVGTGLESEFVFISVFILQSSANTVNVTCKRHAATIEITLLRFATTSCFARVSTKQTRIKYITVFNRIVLY